MRHIIAVIVAFSVIPILSKKKVNISISIFISSLVMAILSGITFNDYTVVLKNTLLDPNKIKQYIVVLEIGVLGVLLKEYNFIDKIIGSLNKIVKNKKLNLMFIPALIGLLVVPGGAIMSAPFIDKLGDDFGIDKPKKAAINLIFRHISMQIVPYSTGLLLVALLVPQISIYRVIGLNFIFVIIYCTIAYNIYIKQIPSVKNSVEKINGKNVFQLLKYTSPIYFAVILNLVFKIPFYIGLLVNFGLLYLISPRKTIFKDIIGAINFKILFSIVSVYLIQQTISMMSGFNDLLGGLLLNPNTLFISIIGVAVFFGLSTGFHPTALGVMLPIISTFAISNTRLVVLTHIVYIWGFVGYFFSPLHLCQLFTCEYLGVETSSLYSKYKKFTLTLIIALLIYSIALLIFVK